MPAEFEILFNDPLKEAISKVQSERVKLRFEGDSDQSVVFENEWEKLYFSTTLLGVWVVEIEWC